MIPSAWYIKRFKTFIQEKSVNAISKQIWKQMTEIRHMVSQISAMMEKFKF